MSKYIGNCGRSYATPTTMDDASLKALEKFYSKISAENPDYRLNAADMLNSDTQKLLALAGQIDACTVTGLNSDAAVEVKREVLKELADVAQRLRRSIAVKEFYGDKKIN